MRERSVSPLRVVQVSFHADIERRDGESLLRAWPTLPAVAGGVARAGVEVTIVQTAHADEAICRDGIDFHFVNDARRTPRRVIERVARLEPEVVHVHGFHHALAVRTLVGAVRGAPVLVQDHGGVPPHGWRRVAWQWAFRSIGGVAFTAREQAMPWIDSGVLPAAVPVFDVLEGSSSFSPGNQSDARRVTGLFGDPCLLWTSRLDANKDPLMMLDAVEHAIPHLPDPRLWCCFGDAPLIELVKTRIAQSEALRDRVVLLGKRPRDDMELFYRAADFYLQTSHREGSGFSLLEALSCGTPAIATNIPPTRRILGDAGSLTPVGDSVALAAAIVEWSSRDRGDQRLAAHARFHSALGYDTVGRELCAAYETLAAERHHVEWKRRRSVVAGQDAKTAKYYDSIATVYDSQVEAVETNRIARGRFLACVSSLVRPGGHIVDFGCGTGIDTSWYAGHGHPVVAYDVSPGMTEIVRQRCAEHIASGRVTVVAGPAQHLFDLLDRSGPVDAVVANFAVFNHIADLGGLFRSLAAHLVPGGIVVTQMLNPFYWRDVGRRWWWRSAARSFGSGSIAFSGRDTTTYRHFSWSVVRAAAGDFTIVDRVGFGSQFSIFVFRRRQ
jgi:glycosyltransferase involved in cell wall biosynthesis/ubiquinone/menaquinone biosynthesis C-methylase UbiE